MDVGQVRDKSRRILGAPVMIEIGSRHAAAIVCFFMGHRYDVVFWWDAEGFPARQPRVVEMHTQCFRCGWGFPRSPLVGELPPGGYMPV
jgi:hypothetical protein